MSEHLKSLSLFGDWMDDPDYVAPTAFQCQHSVFEPVRHPAKIMLEVLRNARGGLRDDQLERQYIASVRDVLASRDRHVGEGLYWQWAVNERNWKELCEETYVSFGRLEEAADNLLDPPLGIASNTKSQWMKRILDASPPTLQHAIFTGGRDGVTVSLAYLLRRTPEQEKKLVRIHKKFARPLTHGERGLPRVKTNEVRDLEQEMVDDIKAEKFKRRELGKWKAFSGMATPQSPPPVDDPKKAGPDVQKAIEDAEEKLLSPADTNEVRKEKGRGKKPGQIKWTTLRTKDEAEADNLKKRSPEGQRAMDEFDGSLLPPTD